MPIQTLHILNEEQRPFKRLGPRPLGLYYAMMQPLISPFLNNTANVPETQHLKAFLEGVKKYHNAPFYRMESPQKCIWQKGRVKVFKYEKKQNTKAPILLIPSMINKSYIFNLMQGHSLIEHLLEQGHNVYLLDWGEPNHNQEPISVEASITTYISQFLQSHGKPIHIAGYCMGGLLALATAQLYPQFTRSLSLFATPWNFSATDAHKQISSARTAYALSINTTPQLTVDLLQTQFVMLSPYATIERFTHYANEEDPETLKRMTLIEDWLADGVELEQTVANTLCLDWFADNTPFAKKWQIDGQIIHPCNIKTPTFVASPKRDIIVPEEACLPLKETAGSNTFISVSSGHIGLMVGRKCKTNFFIPFTNWLETV